MTPRNFRNRSALPGHFDESMETIEIRDAVRTLRNAGKLFTDLVESLQNIDPNADIPDEVYADIMAVVAMLKELNAKELHWLRMYFGQ